ncbi:hypothetical protein GCM10010218_24200 [Streptomyces mashuensis]|uniref:Uncharacterized protein n=1 Tax=Streptomyces mashuensis TaxID=33904 RepID=A0A919ED51_9ACTN|nr:hypothetical protein [Streptomyces mashuensis]GHF42227.1 hypothetical protein GCM10010218_24200 [Streptomyces mashuensis]
MTFTNTGRSAVTAGSVVLGTHVLGPLGTDWTTLPSVHPLPVPIAPGGTAEGRWTVCVDAWRVPPGWWIETRDVWPAASP